MTRSCGHWISLALKSCLNFSSALTTGLEAKHERTLAGDAGY